MNDKTHEKYIRIFVLYKQGIPCSTISDKLLCSNRTIKRAVQWCLENAPTFSSAEHLKIQLEKIKELKLEARQRLRQIQEGAAEKTVRTNNGHVVESVERQRYNFNAEVGFLRLIKDLTKEETTLLGVHDASLEKDDFKFGTLAEWKKKNQKEN